MLKKITMQTKSQGIVIDFFNKPYDNYCKNAKKDKKKCYLLSTPFVFLKLHIFPSLFFRFKKKEKKGGFSKFPSKKNLLGS